MTEKEFAAIFGDILDGFRNHTEIPDNVRNRSSFFVELGNLQSSAQSLLSFINAGDAGNGSARDNRVGAFKHHFHAFHEAIRKDSRIPDYNLGGLLAELNRISNNLDSNLSPEKINKYIKDSYVPLVGNIKAKSLFTKEEKSFVDKNLDIEEFEKLNDFINQSLAVLKNSNESMKKDNNIVLDDNNNIAIKDYDKLDTKREIRRKVDPDMSIDEDDMDVNLNNLEDDEIDPANFDDFKRDLLYMKKNLDGIRSVYKESSPNGFSFEQYKTLATCIKNLNEGKNYIKKDVTTNPRLIEQAFDIVSSPNYGQESRYVREFTAEFNKQIKSIDNLSTVKNNLAPMFADNLSSEMRNDLGIESEELKNEQTKAFSDEEQAIFKNFEKELMDAKSPFKNSPEYLNIIKAVKSFSNNDIKPTGKNSVYDMKVLNLVALGKLLNNYVDHKSKDGVKPNAYNKLQVIQKLSNFVESKAMDHYGRKVSYNGKEYNASDVRLSKNAYMSEIKPKQRGILKELNGPESDVKIPEKVKLVDDCMNKIMIKSMAKNRGNVEELNRLRENFKNNPDEPGKGYHTESTKSRNKNEELVTREKDLFVL